MPPPISATVTDADAWISSAMAMPRPPITIGARIVRPSAPRPAIVPQERRLRRCHTCRRAVSGRSRPFIRTPVDVINTSGSR
jgi:hypothetical protein